jgi:hypothetical protein
MSARIQRLRVDNFKFKCVRFCEFVGQPQNASGLQFKFTRSRTKKAQRFTKKKK